jgi:hypothetical protein
MADAPKDDRDTRQNEELNSTEERSAVPKPHPQASAEEVRQELEAEDRFEATDN